MPDFLHGVEVVELTDGIRPIQLAATSVIGVVGTAPDADAAAYPLNEPVLILGDRAQAALLGAAGTLLDALNDILDVAGAAVVVVRVDEGIDAAATLANVVGGVDVDTGKYLGAQALLAAAPSLGVKPRILCAPGYTHQRPEDPGAPGTFLANPVAAALVGVADKLRAVVVVDGPNTNDADAITMRGDFSSRRVYLHDPWYSVFDTALAAPVVRPGSARVAGVIAHNDNERGWHTSPSNRPVPGIVGVSREIDFTLGDATSRANLLNENEIATTIQQNGFRLWGNRTTSADVKWAFLAHVRIADILRDSLLETHLWAVDRNITKNYIEDVTGGVQAFLNRLTAEQRIAGGRVWAPPELNTVADMAAGKVVFDFDFTPFGVAERITFRSAMVNDHLVEVF
ncbi:MAG: phage tail sheath subtilisin-like domain-containing protein [Pseudomonadales bacterium]|nr:phage tail sheath subtilisin-like domain-containing protein [Pseudomonadales bacterium]